ncbi:hypothetical protein ACF0H5_002508 [Mactra antiquata]
MIHVALLLAYLAVCWAQVTKPCATPTEWEGIRVMTDTSIPFKEAAKYTYDALNRRTRAIVEVQQVIGVDYYDVLHLYNEDKEYRFHLKTKTCNVTKPRHPFFEIRVPSSSELLFDANVGAAQIPGEYLTVQNWDTTFVDGDKYSITVTSTNCIPVSATYYRKNVGFIIENFYNVKLGISDPLAFLQRSECMGL